jgi:hypothetical protein
MMVLLRMVVDVYEVCLSYSIHHKKSLLIGVLQIYYYEQNTSKY